MKCVKINPKINSVIRNDKKLNQAFNFHQKGDLKEAEKLYKEILQLQQDNHTVLYLLGILAIQTGQHQTALSLINKAIEINEVADYHRDLGDMLFDIGKKQEACKYYKRAIELNPEDSETLFNLALLNQELGNFDEAIGCFQNVVKTNPNDFDALNNLGVLFYNHKKDFINAEKYFSRAVQLRPGFVDGYFNLGLVYSSLKQNDKAILNYNKVIKINPKYSKAYFKLGLLFGSDYDKTIECYTKLTELEPDNADAYYNLANAYTNKTTQLPANESQVYADNAIKYYEKLIQLNPNLADAWNNLAKFYVNRGRTEESQACFKKAIELKPDLYEAYIALGNINYNTGEYNAAKENYNKALELKPDSTDAKCALSLIYLRNKDFEQGWANFEYRFYLNNLTRAKLPDIPQPRWKGESIDGKTLLVCHEQGLGDTIQFFRYVYELKKQTDIKIMFKHHSNNLVKLLRQSNSEIEIIEPSTPEESIKFDYFVPIMSLPHILGAKFETIPHTGRYLNADPYDIQTYKENYFNNDKFKVGIAWSCQNKDGSRSFQNLEPFYDIAKLDGVQLYSLQKGSAELQLNELPQDIKIINLGKTFNTMADTAAAIENMDIVLSVDTSIIHLAGALGKQSWVLLNCPCCWRWFEDIDYSPWYGSVRLFKCEKMNDYGGLMKIVTEELKKLVGDKVLFRV